MNDETTYKHAELTRRVIGLFYEVYNELGYGFLESVYAKALALALKQAGIHGARQVPVPVWFRESLVGDFVADIVVEHAVIVLVRSARSLEPFDEATLLNYLRATDIEVGLLLNFGPNPQIKRMAFDNSRKSRRLTQTPQIKQSDHA